MILNGKYCFSEHCSSLTSSNKPGHKVYRQWCTVWEKEYGGTVQPTARGFLADNFLPVWVQCTHKECRRWRKVPPQVELYQVKQDIVHCSNCDQPEDEVSNCIAMVTQIVNNRHWGPCTMDQIETTRDTTRD